MKSNNRQFADLATQHGEHMQAGESTAGNKTHAELTSLADSIPAESRQQYFGPLCRHEDASVRLWAATYLLPIDEGLALATLSEISEDDQSILSLTATATLDMWKKGLLESI